MTPQTPPETPIATASYMAFTSDTDWEVARIQFIAKYQIDPERAYVDRGILMVGPVPEDYNGFYRLSPL